MSGSGKKLYTAIEFGSDKICVLNGINAGNGAAEVLSFAQKSSGGSVVKGLINDYTAAAKILSETISAADKACPKGFSSRAIAFSVNGSAVSPIVGEGAVPIPQEDKVITEKHVTEVIKRAQALTLYGDYRNVMAYDNKFIIDGQRTVRNPIGKTASRLDVRLHITSVEAKRIDAVVSMLRELGFDNGGQPIFAPIASAFAVITDEEQEQGAFLVDVGAGTTSFVYVRDGGIQTSGVVPIGVMNVANDLSIGLDLPYDYCLKFVKEAKLTSLRKEGQNFIEYGDAAGGRGRRIPLESFEKIMFLRIREMFTIVKAKADKAGLAYGFSTGAILCGGGSLIPEVRDIFKEVFSMRVRTGTAEGITGAMTAFESAPECYTVVLGMLKHLIAYDMDDEPDDTLLGLFDSAKSSILGKFDRFVKALKI